MWSELDNNLHDKRHNKHIHDCDGDNDINININVNVDNDRDIDFGHIGGRIDGRRHSGLNLCDVASGIGDLALSFGEGGGAAAAIRELERRKEDPPFIDCGWGGRMLDAHKEDMLLKSSRLRAGLKDVEG